MAIKINNTTVINDSRGLENITNLKTINSTSILGTGDISVQPLDADLTAIAGLSGTSGLLKKTAADTWSLDTATYLTGNQSITVSGDVSGSGTTAISLTLANSGVTAGTYKSVTVDAKGRVTAATNPTTLSGYGITDAVSSSLIGAASGIVPLGADSKIATTYLPSYVDDVLEYANQAGFPASGETGKIYVALDTNKIYRWSGSAYIEISPTAGNADTATKLATARTISLTGDVTGSVSFDGSADASITATIAANSVALGTDTTGNYVASVATTAPLSGGAAGSEGGALTLSLASGYGDTQNPYASKTANYILAAPNGTAGAPTFRAIVAADIPALNYAPTAGSSSITTVGTIASGTWQGTIISPTYGGTGVNNGTRTLAINTNSGALTFTNASTTLTVANTASVSGTNTGDQTITLTGDVTGTGTGSFAATLANSGVTAGTYKSVTVDAKGRVTAGTNPTTLSGYGITDAASLTGTETLTNKTVSGGVYSNVVDVTGSIRSSVVAVAALNIDCSLGNFFTKTINANSTFTFSNAPASKAYSFILELTHTSGTVTWPAAVRWPAGTAPTLTAGKTHLFVFVSDDGGTTWRGASSVDYTN